MKHTVIAVLMAVLVGPGFGQFYNKEFKKGWLLLGITVMVSILFFSALTKASIDMLPAGISELSFEMAQDIHKKLYEKNSAAFILFKLIIFIAWMYGVADAYIGSRRSIVREKRDHTTDEVNRT